VANAWSKRNDDDARSDPSRAIVEKKNSVKECSKIQYHNTLISTGIVSLYIRGTVACAAVSLTLPIEFIQRKLGFPSVF
jgi:hypothetical protein